MQVIPEAHLFLNSLIDPRQVIAFRAHTLAWGLIINSLFKKAFSVGPNIIHIIEHISSVPWGIS